MADVRDRDVTVERAEALQAWLAGFPLSGRAKGALQRELEAIIADGPSGDHPLAGLTIAEFITTLHLPNGGDVGRVSRVGDAVLSELRAAIPADTRAPRKARKARQRPSTPEPGANGTAPVEETPSAPEPIVAPEVVAEAPQVDAPEAEAPQAEAPQAEPAPRRGPGRPKKNATQAPPAPAQEPVEASAEAVAVELPKRRPGRPRRVAPNVAIIDTPGLNDDAARATVVQGRKPESVPGSVNQAAPKVSEVDPVLAHVMQLWPSLHPHARRAIVFYAGSLVAEEAYRG